MSEQASRFTFVDGLRGIASLSVVLFHAVEGNHITELYESIPAPLALPITYGNYGVAIFFVLSGFVIAHSLSSKEMTLSTAGRFMLKRSVRLDPPYWFAILLSIASSTLAAAVLTNRPAETYTFPQLIAHVLYIQDLLGFREINPVFWTLCFEFQFYLVFACLSLFKTRISFPIAFAFSLIWLFRLLPDYPGLFVSLWYGFLLGVGAYFSWKRPRSRVWLAMYVLAVALCGFYFRDLFALVCTGTALALFVVCSMGKLTTALNWSWLQFLGRISYSLYLVHNPITGAVFRAGYMFTGRTVLTEAVWWAVSVGICIIAAALFFVAIERPSIRLSHVLTRSANLDSLRIESSH